MVSLEVPLLRGRGRVARLCAMYESISATSAPAAAIKLPEAAPLPALAQIQLQLNTTVVAAAGPAPAPALARDESVETPAPDHAVAVANSGSEEHLVPAPEPSAASKSTPKPSSPSFLDKIVGALKAPLKRLRKSASQLSLGGIPVAPEHQQLQVKVKVDDTATAASTTPKKVKPAKVLKGLKKSVIRRVSRTVYNQCTGLATRANTIDPRDYSVAADMARMILEYRSRDLAAALAAPASLELGDLVKTIRAAIRGTQSEDPEVVGAAVAAILQVNKPVTYNRIYVIVKGSIHGTKTHCDAVVQKWIRVAEHALNSNADFVTFNAISSALEMIDAHKVYAMAPHERRALKRIMALNNVCDKVKGVKEMMEAKVVAAAAKGTTAPPRMVPLITPVLTSLYTAKASPIEGSYAKEVAKMVDFFDRIEMPMVAPAPEAVAAAIAALI
ncbi:hypothetical protein H9P43_005655 [Blastocladiella emersonii ATCC 22665]|nr:hypothetical protein H9P43_005655 [Blastocladiella emersonii ATCC 22665]